MSFDFDFSCVLPSQTFYTPTPVGLKALASLENVRGILEAGCGQGLALSMIRAWGKANDVPYMEHSRGFDVNFREVTYDNSIFRANALNAPFYHENLAVLVCRPNHDGWVESLLNTFLSGAAKTRYFIYVGLDKNLDIDLDQDQLYQVSKRIEGVGKEGEIMLIWEFKHD